MDFFHKLAILDERNYSYRSRVLRANEGIDFVDFLYQSRPISPESLAGQFRSFDLEALDRFKETGDFVPESKI